MADGSRWISNERSREVVQQLRGRVDAIIVGSGTARADDPLLTARPTESGRREAQCHASCRRFDRVAPLESQLVKTARDVPVLVASPTTRPMTSCQRLVAAGVEIFRCDGAIAR